LVLCLSKDHEAASWSLLRQSTTNYSYPRGVGEHRAHRVWVERVLCSRLGWKRQCKSFAGRVWSFMGICPSRAATVRAQRWVAFMRHWQRYQKRRQFFTALGWFLRIRKAKATFCKHAGQRELYFMSRNRVSGPYIGLPGQIFAGLLLGKGRNQPSGRPKAGRRADLGAFLVVRPKSGQNQARKDQLRPGGAIA
jgi:hypothetical protein